METADLLFAAIVRKRVLAKKDFFVRKYPEEQWEDARKKFNIKDAVRSEIDGIDEIAAIIQEIRNE